MKRFLMFFSLMFALVALGCNFEDIEIPDLSGNDKGEKKESTVGDNGGSSNSSHDESNEHGETDEHGESAEHSQTDANEESDAHGETDAHGESPGESSRSSLEALSGAEAKAAAALVAAGAKIKVEDDHVTELSGYYGVFTPEQYQLIYQLTSLKALDLEESNVEDSTLVGIEKLRFLEYINLDGAKITDAGMGQVVLKGTPDWIDADNTKVSGNTLDGLLKSGKTLTVSLARMNHLPDEDLSAAAKLSKNRLGLIGSSGEYGNVEQRPAKVAGRDQVD